MQQLRLSKKHMASSNHVRKLLDHITLQSQIFLSAHQHQPCSAMTEAPTYPQLLHISVVPLAHHPPELLELLPAFSVLPLQGSILFLCSSALDGIHSRSLRDGTAESVERFLQCLNLGLDGFNFGGQRVDAGRRFESRE